MSPTATLPPPIRPTAPHPAPVPARTPYHLTPEQIRFFDENGYLILRNWITGPLLERLQRAGDAWIDQSLDELNRQKALEAAGQPLPTESDYRFAQRANGRVPWRVDYLHNKGERASLEMLGAPQVLAVVESLTGPNFVPTYEAMVFKQKGDGEIVPWHQDAVHPRAFRIYNYDLYLDHSRVGAGALRVVPGSHRAPVSACDLHREHGWDIPGAIDVPMAPGDVLIHDVMIVHGSARTEGNDLRRTIYYEFRAAEQIHAEGPWDAAWIEKRTRLVPIALAAHAEAFPGADQFQWNAAPEFRPAPLPGGAAEELRVAHVVHTPGAFCSAGDVLAKARADKGVAVPAAPGV